MLLFQLMFPSLVLSPGMAWVSQVLAHCFARKISRWCRGVGLAKDAVIDVAWPRSTCSILVFTRAFFSMQVWIFPQTVLALEGFLLIF
jgi:hypothetical protein